MPNDEGSRTGFEASSEGRNIDSLLADRELWAELLDSVSARIQQPNLYERMVLKDLYVTEAIRHAVVPSTIHPEALVVFRGGTSLAKAYSILNRFSEDVDVNVVPPPDQTFGDSRRRNVRRELHSRLDERIKLPKTHKRSGTNFATTTIQYPTTSLGPAATDVPLPAGPVGPTFGEVLIEMNIRSQPPSMHAMRSVTSFAGDAAADMDESLLQKYPFLRPFDVLTADPMIAVVDKLDALHWRANSDQPQRTRERARDVYDLACLLRNDKLKSRLNSDLVAELHEIIVNSIPTGLAVRATSRPSTGFATSAAFRTGHDACEALRDAYPMIQSFVYADKYWIEFDDALETIIASADLL